MSAARVRAVVSLAVIIWGVLLLLEGTPLNLSYLRPYEIVVGAVILLIAFYDAYLWRMWPFSLFSPWPVLHGTWTGELRSAWVDPSTGKGRHPIRVYLAIRQTAATVRLGLSTPESRSSSMSASISADRSNPRYLVSTYQNVPQLRLRPGSPIHHGGLILEINARFPKTLSGWYWTDRDTKGELALDGHTPSVITDYAVAGQARYEKGVRPRLGPLMIGRL
jgi:hypothetical protein